MVLMRERVMKSLLHSFAQATVAMLVLTGAGFVFGDVLLDELQV